MATGCAAKCGTPMDPVLLAQGWAMHPGCEYPADPGWELRMIREAGRARRRAQEAKGPRRTSKSASVARTPTPRRKQ